ncbi:MAG TPA: ATP-dependent DNA helicase [Acidobacteriota bacterium]|nr:ATP-dependent DNA helicase [Acidobacteriota bacterium]
MKTSRNIGSPTSPPAETLDEIFLPGGVLDQALQDYEFRPSQLEMARAVSDAVRNGGTLCVEAGTGTGKTLAYLIPALLSGKRVMVSTATKNLQEQIFQKDIPFLRRHLFANLRAVCMMGRNNYLCLRRLEDHSRYQARLPFSRGKSVQKLREWAFRTATGERGELHWLADADPLWNQLDARSEICVGQKCRRFEDCFVTLMRKRAFEAHLIVANHAFLFANVALETDEIGRILPEFSTLIIDEAHEVEDIAGNYFGTHFSTFQLEELCRDCERDLEGNERFPRRIEAIAASALRLVDRFGEAAGRQSLNFFRRPDGFVVDLRDEHSDTVQAVRAALEVLAAELDVVRNRTEETESLRKRAGGLLAAVEEIFGRDSEDHVYWFERRGKGVAFHVTPIQVGACLRQHLYSRTATTVLTSATLATSGNFSFLKNRLGLEEAEELLTHGEFDHFNQAILFVPSGFPDPGQPDYQTHAIQAIRRILAVTDGGAFLLCTSVAQMRRFSEVLRRDGDYAVLCQGETPKGRLLESFKRTPRAVLCGTYSFWQGVDVRGEALRCVIIDKLPFQVPGEPVVAARLQLLKENGENPFAAYSLPSAIITLKQGLGRLIRSRRDRGILAVLDSRMRTRSYGIHFFESLPKCRITDKMKDLENFFRQDVS